MQQHNLSKAIDYLGGINGNRIRRTVAFKEFLSLLAHQPDKTLRNVFQLFYTMVTSHISHDGEACQESQEAHDLLSYDCSPLLIEGSDYPFFADRLFANRLVNVAEALKRSAQQNKIYIFKGPPGSGKSTFLNNLLRKFEEFTGTEQGLTYRTLWRLDPKQLQPDIDLGGAEPSEEPVEVPCPCYDHPILVIPKSYRGGFFRALFSGSEFENRLQNDKEFDWVWRNEPCTICSSLYYALLERLKDPWRVFEMVYAQPYQFNRRLGEGINVFTPGDKPLKHNSIRNPEVQKRIDNVLKDSNRVKYLFSQFAKTNNGVYALMDVKAHNRTRLMELHNIISEGTHKVEDIEESVHSLFLAVMNPEDTQSIEEFQSFEDRIEYIKIPYVMDVNTEVEIYRNTFGKQIEERFLPMVLENFARTIISSRLNPRSPALLDWIGNPRKYSRYCDDNLHLLKMEVYSGRIPKWLSEEDRKRFSPEVRGKVIAEGEKEGDKGISGRESIKIFNDLYSRYAKNGSLINMATLKEFFSKVPASIKELIPQGFLGSMIKLYNFSVLQEVKECLYYYNEERISRDIQNYLFAVNFEPESSHTCIYTGEKIDINADFFSNIESRLLGSRENKYFRNAFREEIQRRYTSHALPLEILQDGKDIRATKLYLELYERYVYNLKEKVLEPFLDNENFRRAIKDFEEPEFSTYDKRIQDDISFLINNLGDKFGYTKEGAKEICITLWTTILPKSSISARQ